MIPCEDCPCHATPTQTLDTEKGIEELVRKVHIEWLSKAKTAKINGSEMTVLPYGYLEQAVRKALIEEQDENYREMNKQMAEQYKAGHSAAITKERSRLHAAIEGEKRVFAKSRCCSASLTYGKTTQEMVCLNCRSKCDYTEVEHWNAALTRIQDLLFPNK